MARRFNRLVEGHEISLTRKGANQHATVVLMKSAIQPPEIPEMDINLLKTVAAFSDVEKNYFATLEGDAATSFVKAAPEQRSAEATAWKTESDRKALEAEAAKSGVSAEVLEIRKANEDLRKANESLLTRVADLEKKDHEANLRKRAEAPEFSGYPGGPEAVVTILRSVEKLDKDSAEAIVKSAATAAAMARRTGAFMGLSPDERQSELQRSAPAKAEYEAAIAETMKSAKCARADAVKQLREDPSRSDLIRRVFEEEGVA